MRLQKYLAQCGVASRRASEEMIAQGRVCVNGLSVTEMGVQEDEGDQITVDGKPVTPETEKRVILYNKRAGEVTTVSDDRGRETVLDHFRDFPVRLFPVGRLDYDSEGLLLLTNDGDLAQRLLHPRAEVDKVYLARVTGDLTTQEVRQLEAGVMLEGDARRTAPAKVRVIRRETFASMALVTIHEGRNRQVRRMFASVGHKVLFLRRVQFGPILLGDLPCGQWRDLTQEEIDRLSRL